MIGIRIPWQVWAALAVIIALGGAYTTGEVKGDGRGYARAQEEQRAATAQLNERLSHADEQHRAATAAFVRAMAENADLQRRLEDAANADPNADRAALGVDSVLRLGAIR